jgi:hypothetical protein
MAAKLVPITLKQAEQDTKATSLWVMNNTNPRGPINVNMPDGLGGVTIMVVPLTWIPVDLTTQAARDSLLKSPPFRRLVTSNLLSLVSDESAEAFMENPEAKEEARKVYSYINNSGNLDVENSEAGKVLQESSGDISGFALSIVESELDEDKVLSMVRNQTGAMSSKDFEYIAQHCKYTRVREFCAEQAVS